MISIIAAIAKNGIIGKDNSLPWNLKEDMKHFKELTMGKPIIMGRKTFESIGKPLPNRENIVLTTKKDYNPSGCKVFNSVKETLDFIEDYPEAMVIGGASVYKQFLPIAEKMYLTIIDKEFEGDTFFPKYDKDQWKIEEEKKIKNNNKPFNFSFITLVRK